jgi:hypothetical protein
VVALFAFLSCGQGSGSPATTSTTVGTVGSVKTETPPFSVIQESALPSLPQAGDKANDPNFPGATILRLTDPRTGSADVRDDSNNAINNSSVQVQYSYWPVFNNNSTRLHVVGIYPIPTRTTRSVLFTFDPTTMTASQPRVLLKRLPPPAQPDSLLERSDMIWSGVDPDVIFGNDRATGLWAYNVVSDTYQLMKDFDNTLPGNAVDGLLAGEGITQMSRSLDDQVFAFTITDAAGPKGYLIWRRKPETLTRVLDGGILQRRCRYPDACYRSGDTSERKYRWFRPS